MVPMSPVLEENLNKTRCYAALLVLSLACTALLGASPQNFIDSGKQFEEEQRWGEALYEYLWILNEIDPDYVDAHYRLGIVYGKLGAVEDSIASYNNVLRLNPHHQAATRFLEGYYINEGIAYRRESQFDRALNAFSKALSINTSSASANFELGQEYQRRGQLDDAIVKFKEAARLDPAKSAASTQLASVYSERGEHGEAIKQYLAVIKQHPRDPKAHDGLGVAYNATGQSKKAIEALGQAVRFYLIRGERDQARPAYNLQKQLMEQPPN